MNALLVTIALTGAIAAALVVALLVEVRRRLAAAPPPRHAAGPPDDLGRWVADITGPYRRGATALAADVRAGLLELAHDTRGACRSAAAAITARARRAQVTR